MKIISLGKMGLTKTCVLMSVLLCACVVSASPLDSDSSATEHDHENRESRLFNLQFLPFVKVTVDPIVCSGKADNSSGICSNKNDCKNEGGKADGTCANGYGVCCIYEKRCGGKVNKNVTYLVNDAFPDAMKTVGNCQYNVEKASSDICQLRLDFLTLDLQGPETTSTCDKDTFTFVGTAGANPTVICGQNSGQHMYLDLAQGSGAARINIATTDDVFDRTWRIKVTQIACDSVSRAPANCLQYFTEYSGSLKTFNYAADGDVQQLANQRYTICIRTREGFCGIRYIADDFSLTADGTVPGVAALGDANCADDFVLIASMNKDGGVTTSDRFCGSAFDDLISYSKPFEVRVVTNEIETPDVSNKGFSIRYTQIPC